MSYPQLGRSFLMQANARTVLAVLTGVYRKLPLVLAQCGFAFATAVGLIISVTSSCLAGRTR